MDAETSRRRLMLVVEKLRALPEERFYYGTWVGRHWGGLADLSCGTTACALGWATTVPELATAGLCMRLGEIGAHVSLVDETELHGASSYDHSFIAAATVFGISVAEAEYLFTPGWDSGAIDDLDLDSSPDDDATADQVAEHIEKFVKQKFGGAK